MWMEVGQFLGVLGCALRLFSQLDHFLEGLTDFPSVLLDGLGRIRLQQFPEFGIGPRLRMDLAPVRIG